MTHSQRGQVMAFIAMALALVLMPVAAYAIDNSSVSGAAAGLQEATAMAAMEAAQQLDVGTFRAGGGIVVDAASARTAARDVLAVYVPSASLTELAVNGDMITVAAVEMVSLPLDFLPSRVIRLEARASARLAGGYNSPSSRLPFPTSTF